MSGVSSNSTIPLPGSAYKGRERLLIAAAVALVGCRLLSVRHSVMAMVVAALILAAVFTGFVAFSTSLRRWAVYVALPLVAAANAVALAVGSLVVYLAEYGLLVYNRLGLYMAWNRGFYCVPVAAGANLLALAWPCRRARAAAWLANVALLLDSGWHWRVHESQDGFGGAPPFGATLTATLAMASLMNLAWDKRPDGAAKSRGHRRAVFVVMVAGLVAILLVAPFSVVLRRCRLEAALTSLGCEVTDRTRRPAWLRIPELAPLRPYVTEIEAVYIPTGNLTAANCRGFADVLGRVTMLDELDAPSVPPGCEGLLDQLGPTSFMQYLLLRGPGVDDGILAKAGMFARLRKAEFSDAQITDAGLAKLTGLAWLETLVLRGTPINGSGLAAIAASPCLTQLDLAGTRVDDEHLPILQQFVRLTSLDLRNTRVTAAGVVKLRQALPQCDIRWGP